MFGIVINLFRNWTFVGNTGFSFASFGAYLSQEES